MSKWDMYEHGFDPYDTLLEAVERIQRLEHAHNNLAKAFEKSERELNTALKSLNSLQRSHMAALKTIDILSSHVVNK
jgi:geranylgeranyl pyrophosphate synthase